MKVILAFIREISESRELLRELIRRDLTSKYKGTYMGFVWSVINPLVMLGIYTFVFSYLFKVRFRPDAGGGHFVLYLFCGLVPWLAFSDAVNRCAGIILENSVLVKKSVFPLEILPLHVVLSGVFTELIGLGILLFATVVTTRALSPFIIIIPLLMILQIFFALGLGMLFGSLTVFFRDIRYIVALMLPMWMFLTPIMYPETLIPERARILIWMNPMALLVGMFRNAILDGTMPEPAKVGVLVGMVAVVFYGGLLFFRKTKSEFADVV
jgi:lipopolysaccharide transport system permease protein